MSRPGWSSSFSLPPAASRFDKLKLELQRSTGKPLE
jgi:hypothetical protein